MKFNKLKKKYYGEIASNYEAVRLKQDYWHKEQEIMEQFLKEIKEELGEFSVLDIPVGTGRFFNYYKDLNLKVTGLDISEDMLAQAQKKSDELNFPVELEKGDITNIDFPENSFDLISSTRIFTLLNKNNFSEALKEVGRVSNNYIVLSCYFKKNLGNIPFYKKLILKLRGSISIFIRIIQKDVGLRIDQYKLNKLLIENNLKIKKVKIIKKGNSCYDFVFYLLKKQP